MKIGKYINSQFGKPHGTIGKLVGRIMWIKNKERIRWVVEKLNVQQDDDILEIGFGPGLAVKMISEKLISGTITGIDHSDVMLKRAIKLNSPGIKNNKTKLLLCPVQDIRFPEDSFDKIFGSNVHFFWKDQVSEFIKLRRVLKNNGKLFMIFQPRWARNEEDIRNISTQLMQKFKEAGFSNVKEEFKPMKPFTCISVSGVKG